MESVANSYANLGRYAEALKLHEETLAMLKAVLGPDNPGTLSGMHNLGNRYHDVGRHADALMLHEETLAMRKAKLGPDHPDTLKSMSVIALCYRDLGRYADALKLHEETLALRKATLGPDHPDTLKSMDSVAVSYSSLGRHAEALRLFEETLALQKAKLGPDHPSTLLTMDNIATCYRNLGRHAEALKLRQETLARRQSKLGPEHPDTLESMWRVTESLVATASRHRGGADHGRVPEGGRGQVASPGHDCTHDRVSATELRQGDGRGRLPGDGRDVREAEAGRRRVAGTTSPAYVPSPRPAIRASDKSETAAKDAAAEADRAMAWLKQAVAAGFKDADLMKPDKDLDALRDREDFQKLLADLEADQEKQKR